jgi:hypothetical protein
MSLDGSQLYEDTHASQDSETVNSLNCTTHMSNTGTKSRIAPNFPALSFRMTVKAGLSNAVDKGALLPLALAECEGGYCGLGRLGRLVRLVRLVRLGWISAPALLRDRL